MDAIGGASDDAAVSLISILQRKNPLRVLELRSGSGSFLWWKRRRSLPKRQGFEHRSFFHTYAV
jgi:hypothetical protein